MDSVVDYIIRPLYPEEIHLLRDFLYEAIFIPEGVEPLPRDVVDLPELKLYIQTLARNKMIAAWLSSMMVRWLGQCGHVL